MAESSGPYPFPYTLHVASSVTIKLSDSNYLLWKTQFKSLLRCQKLLGFVNGSVPKPPTSIVTNVNNHTVETPNPEYEAWIYTDELIKSWIFGTLTKEVLGLVHALSTSQDVWLSLAGNFNKSSVAREFDLRRWLQLLNIKGKNFTTYCREFRAVCDSLSSIGKLVDEHLKIFTFLNGLGRKYDPITTVLQSSMSRSPAPTFNDVVLEISGLIPNCNRTRQRLMSRLILRFKLKILVFLGLDREVADAIVGVVDTRLMVGASLSK